MKKHYFLLVLVSLIGYSQNKTANYDYFVQFNMPQISNKISMDSLLNHKAFKDFNKEEEKLQLRNFSKMVDVSQPAVIHGNFSDTITYYQVSLPIKNAALLEEYLQKNMETINSEATDSIYDEIIKKGNYSVYSPQKSDFTLAWNATHLVLYQILDSTPAYNPYDYYDEIEEAADSTYDESEEYDYEEAEYAEDDDINTVEAEDDVVVEVISAEEWAEIQKPEVSVEEYDEDYVYEEDYDESDDEEYDAYYAEQSRLLRLEKQRVQEEQLDILFENGFKMPTFTKINQKADISSWINYQSIYSQMNSFYYMLRTFSARKPITTYENLIKGMTVDMNFENDKATMEQTIEYSAPLAKIMNKVLKRKINKRIYNYFPKSTPLGYLSYHLNSKEVLKNYPAIVEQAFANLPLDTKDTEIITDLFSTFIDEEAVASLFDGDFSFFFHGMEQYEANYISYTYDDDYNETEVEETLTKTRPIFTFIMTSTHKTMATKLIDLGVRKNLLAKENGHYIFTDVEQEMKGLKIIKDNDVLVFTNGIEYLNSNTTSTFSNQVKKELRSNYIVGTLDMKNLFRSILDEHDMGSDTAYIMKMIKQLDKITLKSSKKIKDNKVKFEVELKSNENDKNIVLQMLDFATYLK